MLGIRRMIFIDMRKSRKGSFCLFPGDQDSKEPLLKCRHVTAFFGFLIFFLLSIHRTIMSVAIVAMVNTTAIKDLSAVESDSCPSLIMNNTKEDSFQMIQKEGELIWPPHIQGYVLGSYFLGYVTTQLPTGILAERYGFKWFLFASSLVTGVLTLLIPPISYWSVSAVIAVQASRGLAQGLVHPSLAILTSNWFPKNERGFLYSFMVSAASLGTAFGSIFTGYVCESPGGWPYSFYAVGISTVALSLLSLIFVTESPRVHPRISKAELDYILKNQENTFDQKRPKRPWGKMLTSVPVYAFISGFFGHIWSQSQYWTVQSTFLGTILHYPISENGIFTAIPFLVQFVANQVASWITLYQQKKNTTSVNFLRKFWNILSGVGFSACLLGMYFAGCLRTVNIIFGILSVGFTGLATPGIMVVATDMAPTFSGSLHAITCTVSYLATFILPVIVGYLTDQMQTIEQWNKVFFISIGVVMGTKIIFVLFGSAELQPWNFVEQNAQLQTEKRTENSKKNIIQDKSEETSRC